MLLKKDLMNSMDSMYGDMLKTVSIPDFTKCIAQFSGMRVQDISDDLIREYLVTWAEHKYKYYKMLGNKTRLDMPITYQNIKDDICLDIEALRKEFPGFGPWLAQFEGFKTNKIDDINRLGYYGRDWMRDYFPNYLATGNTITGFFKRQLKAPDELVTALGRIFENDTITGTYTISIDPVDMMLASENPYKWQSCYRLEVPNDASHADGCLAAILDTSSLITYIWDKEGKFNLYNYELKSVRYKRIREWLAISPDMKAIHFNQIYPGKHAYPDEFRKQLRDKVETVIADYLEMPNIWVKTTDSWCAREIYYGYGEFDSFNIWKIKDSDEQNWDVYDTGIKCPCGCGMILSGSDDQEGYCYDGEGFICESFRYEDEEDRPYCSIAEDYCYYADDICDCNCRGCRYYDDEYPLCNLDDTTECENVDVELVDNGRMQSCSGHCEGCPLWAKHHPEESSQEEEEMETETVTVSTGDVRLGVNLFDINMGAWHFTPTENTSYYTLTPEQISDMLPQMPELPSYINIPNTTSFSETVSLDQIREAVEQAPPLNVMDITNEMIREARDKAIAAGTIKNEIVFGEPRSDGQSDFDYEAFIYGLNREE